jgi:hypothetical protein
MIKRVFLTSSVAIASILNFPFFVSAETPITSSNSYIAADTVWNEADSPYVIYDSVYVTNSAILTIEPGTVVKFTSDRGLKADGGHLVISGTEGKPVYFTSIKDDSALGDTNGDSSTTTPHEDDWGGIDITRSSSTVISHMNLGYSNWGIFMWNASVEISKAPTPLNLKIFC